MKGTKTLLVLKFKKKIEFTTNLRLSFGPDDMLIKLWDWDKKWSCSQVFEGHTHYVMQIVINPKDNNQFASASLDRTIKVGCLLYVSVITFLICFPTENDPAFKT